MGFDGMDPTLARKFMDEGKLPNLKKLADSGTFAKLETTQPSESPVARASFATGVNPGKHNIYDFLVRDFDTYMPDLGGVSASRRGSCGARDQLEHVARPHAQARDQAAREPADPAVVVRL